MALIEVKGLVKSFKDGERETRVLTSQAAGMFW